MRCSIAFTCVCVPYQLFWLKGRAFFKADQTKFTATAAAEGNKYINGQLNAIVLFRRVSCALPQSQKAIRARSHTSTLALDITRKHSSVVARVFEAAVCNAWAQKICCQQPRTNSDLFFCCFSNDKLKQKSCFISSINHRRPGCLWWLEPIALFARATLSSKREINFFSWSMMSCDRWRFVLTIFILGCTLTDFKV